MGKCPPPIEVTQEEIENLIALIILEFKHGPDAVNQVLKKAKEIRGGE